MGNVILGLLLVGYIVVTIVNLVIEVKRDKETRPLRIRESRSQMYLAFELARFNKNIEKLRQFIKYKRFGLYTSLCILQQNYTIINKMV